MLFEWFELIGWRVGDFFSRVLLGVISACSVLLLQTGHSSLALIVLTLTGIFCLLCISFNNIELLRSIRKEPSVAAADVNYGLWLSGGILYCVMPALAIVWLRSEYCGFWIVLLLVAIVCSTDIGAYYIGRLFGGKKICVDISSNKTWSGAFGGLCFAIVAGLLFLWWNEVVLSFWHVGIIGFLSFVSQIGDLFESLIKRRFGVKDSGNLIPGHGGVLDRVDGIVFVVCVVALMHLLYGAEIAVLLC